MKIFTLFALVIFSNLFASTSTEIAKAIIVRGEANVKRVGIDSVDKITVNDKFFEGDIIKTSAKSFVKVIFNDKSQMNLGPESEMVISSFPKGEAGVITLVKGQLRSKVSKDYSKIEKKDQSKLFVKTKTAAMGVRGTDFLVIYNEKNQNTALITFEGRVAMAKFDEREDFTRATQAKLEQMVSSSTAVMVQRGQFSGSSPEANRATIPVKISPKQFEVLQKNENLDQIDSKTDSQNTSKAVRSPIPPGVNSKSFTVNDTKKIEQITGIKNREQDISENKNANPEGGFTKDGGFAPTAGGPIDLKTGIYIAPDPTRGTFDSNTGTYHLDPLTQGRVSGANYQPPTINGIVYKLTDDGRLVIDQERTKLLTKDDGRAPASANLSPMPLLPPPISPIDNYREPAMDSNNLIQEFEMDFCIRYPSNAACSGSTGTQIPIPQDFSRVKFILQIK